jgi:protein translocase SecG subunit
MLSLINLIALVGAVLVILIILQVRDGGLNVTMTGTLQAPIEKRGGARTMHMATIVLGAVFVILCIAQFLV